MAFFNKNNKNENNVPEFNNDPPATDNTPKALDFNRYFLAERRVFLENVSYETTKPEAGAAGYKLTAKDTIVSQVVGTTGVKVTFNRTLKFDPDGPFVLSVSYAVMLIFNPGTRDEIDWKTVDMSKEFQKNCGNLIATMVSRAALLIGEITSAAGQVPVIMGMPAIARPQ